jgi:bifunctional DNA-binding transcriptional regulator/antitoxin component of YhaV-PrlF toxin-antitoxin module
LPLPAAPSPLLSCSTIVGVATPDVRGRLAEATVVRALGWDVGTRLDIRVRAGLVLITADPHAVFRVTQPGQVRIPAGARDWCDLTAGHRVLLIADLDAGLLVVHPPAALTAMISQFHFQVLGGEAE